MRNGLLVYSCIRKKKYSPLSLIIPLSIAEFTYRNWHGEGDIGVYDLFSFLCGCESIMELEFQCRGLASTSIPYSFLIRPFLDRFPWSYELTEPHPKTRRNISYLIIWIPLYCWTAFPLDAFTGTLVHSDSECFLIRIWNLSFLPIQRDEHEGDLLTWDWRVRQHGLSTLIHWRILSSSLALYHLELPHFCLPISIGMKLWRSLISGKLHSSLLFQLRFASSTSVNSSSRNSLTSFSLVQGIEK